MDNGLELAASFSLPPNQKGLCGPGKADWQNKDKLAAILRQFRAPYAYLSLIAEANGMEPFDYETVEAFWIGNKMLDRVSREDVAEMIRRRFVGPDLLSPARASALASSLPRRVYPHHAFHVFYIGSISGVLKRTRPQLDACRVAWGEVKEVGKKSVQVHYWPVELSQKNKKANLSSRLVRSRWNYDSSRFSPEVGGQVASHWGVLAAILNPRQAKNLEKYTQINMKMAGERPRGWD